MDIKEKIANDFKEALKSGDSFKRSLLGMIKSAIHNKEIEQGSQEEGLKEEEIIAVIASEAKKRKEAAKEFTKGGRDDLAENENKELVTLKEYLPEELSPEKIALELKKVIEELGTNKKKDFGRLMGEAAKRLKGQAEGGAIKEELEKLLE
jgi:hypothetical protein